MTNCKECIHHLVCAIYGPTQDDCMARGEHCSGYKNEENVVEVVRCKDCDYYSDIKCPFYYPILKSDNDFCSRGRRRPT